MKDDELLRRLEVLHQQQVTIIDRLGAIERRLQTSEDRLAQLGGGLAVVLSRSEDTKKKLLAWPASSRSASLRAWRV